MRYMCSGVTKVDESIDSANESEQDRKKRKRREACKRWYAKRGREYHAIWRNINRDRVNELSRIYKAEQRSHKREEINRKKRELRLKNLDAYRKYEREKAKQTRKLDPEKQREKDRAKRLRRITKIREAARKYARKASGDMNDYYIKALLKDGSCLKSEDIPKYLIELKRAHLKIKRNTKTNEERTILDGVS